MIGKTVQILDKESGLWFALGPSVVRNNQTYYPMIAQTEQSQAATFVVGAAFSSGGVAAITMRCTLTGFTNQYLCAGEIVSSAGFFAAATIPTATQIANDYNHFIPSAFEVDQDIQMLWGVDQGLPWYVYTQFDPVLIGGFGNMFIDISVASGSTYVFVTGSGPLPPPPPPPPTPPDDNPISSFFNKSVTLMQTAQTVNVWMRTTGPPDVDGNTALALNTPTVELATLFRIVAASETTASNVQIQLAADATSTVLVTTTEPESDEPVVVGRATGVGASNVWVAEPVAGSDDTQFRFKVLGTEWYLGSLTANQAVVLKTPSTAGVILTIAPGGGDDGGDDGGLSTGAIIGIIVAAVVVAVIVITVPTVLLARKRKQKEQKEEKKQGPPTR